MKPSKTNAPVIDINTVTIADLESKIDELTKAKQKLDRVIEIDPLSASAEDIIRKTEAETSNRERAQYLEATISSLAVALTIKKRDRESQETQELANTNWETFTKNAARIQKKIEDVKKEIEGFKTQAAAIASNHKKATGRLALDNRIPRDYVFPTIETVGDTVIVHILPESIVRQAKNKRRPQ